MAGAVQTIRTLAVLAFVMLFVAALWAPVAVAGDDDDSGGKSSGSKSRGGSSGGSDSGSSSSSSGSSSGSDSGSSSSSSGSDSASSDSSSSSGSSGSSDSDDDDGGDSDDDDDGGSRYYQRPSKAQKESRESEPVQSVESDDDDSDDGDSSRGSAGKASNDRDDESDERKSKDDRDDADDENDERPVKLEVVNNKKKDRADEAQPIKINAIARNARGDVTIVDDDDLEFEIDEDAGVFRDGVFYPSRKAGTYPVTIRYTEDGREVVSKSTYTVEPGAAAGIRVYPEATTLDLDEPKTFSATLVDAAHNKLDGRVTWSVVDGPGAMDSEGRLVATGTGVVTVMAETIVDGEVLRSYATADVAAPEADFDDEDGDGEDDEPTTVVPKKVKKNLKDVEQTALQVALTKAAPGARLDIAMDAITAADDVVVASSVKIAPQGDGPTSIPEPVSGLGLVIETQPGDMDAVPEEMDAGELMAQMGRGLAKEPGVFLSVRGTEEIATADGVTTVDMDSARLSQVIDSLDVRFKVPAAYFDEHQLLRHEVVLLEFSDGRQVGELTAARVGTSFDGLFYEFEASLEDFSSFAIIGKAINLVTGDDEPDLSRQVLQQPAAGIASLDMIVAGDQAPIDIIDVPLDDPAIGSAPADVTKAFYVDTEADIVDMTVRVALDPADVLDAKRAVLLHHMDGVWVAADGLDLKPQGAQYVGTASSDCCSLFAIGFDSAPPVLGVPVPPQTITGAYTLHATAQDLGVESVSFLIDGQVVASDATAPYSHRFQSASLENGLHEITIVARDMAGNENRVRQVVAIHNDPTFGQASILGAISDSAIRGPAGGAIAMALLFIGGSVLVLGRTKRSTMLTRRDIDASFVVEVDNADHVVAVPRRVEGDGHAVRKVHIKFTKKTTGRFIIDVDHDDEAAGTADDLIPDLLRFDFRWQGSGMDTLADVIESIVIDVEVPTGRAKEIGADMSTVHFAQRPEQVDGTLSAASLGGSRYRGVLSSHPSWGLEAAPIS